MVQHISMVSLGFSRAIGVLTGSMHVPVLHPSAPTKRSSVCLWFTETDLQAARGYSIPCLDTSLPAPPVLPAQSLTVVPEAPPPQWMMTRHHLKLSHHCNLLQVTSTGYYIIKDKLFYPSAISLNASTLCAAHTSKNQLEDLLLVSWEVLVFITFPSALSI